MNTSEFFGTEKISKILWKLAPPVMLAQGLASMVRMGGQVQIAQYIGRGEREKAHKYAQAAVQLAVVMGLLFAAGVLIFINPLIGFFQLTDSEALAAALSYTKIARGLIVFSFLTLTLTGIYTAQGDHIDFHGKRNCICTCILLGSKKNRGNKA